MTVTHHMPAPWSFEIPTRGPVQIKSRHGFLVGTALTIDDARVMTAAPELRDALVTLLAAVYVGDGPSESDDLEIVAAYHQATAALAKVPAPTASNREG